MSYVFTDKGCKEVERFIVECEAKRKEILDAGIDTNSRDHIPTLQDILDEINCDGLDVNGEYFGIWGVTDNYISRFTLVLGEDLVRDSEEKTVYTITFNLALTDDEAARVEDHIFAIFDGVRDFDMNIATK